MQKLAIYKRQRDKLGLNISDELLEAITKSLGSAIYKRETEIISVQKGEIAKIKKEFLGNKLGLGDNPILNEHIWKVLEKLGLSNKRKYRVLVYCLLVIKFGKQSYFI